MPKSERGNGSFLEKLTNSLFDDAVAETNAETYPRPASLTVRNVNGAVSIVGTDRADADLRYTKRGPTQSALDRVSIETSVDDAGGLQVTVDDPDSGRTAVELEIAVPRGLELDAISTANGTIDVRGTGGNAALKAKNGRITVAGHEGYVDARTKNGAIDLTDVSGIDRAEAANGKISLDLRSIRTDAEIATTAGEIDVRAAPIDADVVIETTVGSIDAPLLGRTSTTIGHTVVEETLGDGGPTLRIANSVGSIRLRAMDSSS